MAEDDTIVSGYDAGNVSLGKPGVNGVLYRAPYGTELPENAVDPLPAVWKSVGYIGEDGITNSTDTDNTTVNDMGGTAVLNTISSFTETYQFVMIETNAESLKARYGDANVVTDANGKPVSVRHRIDDGKASSWVKEIAMTGGRIKRTVIPNATRSEFGDLVDVGTDAIGYDLTIAANPDKRIGNATSADYFAETDTTGGEDVPVDTVTVDKPTVEGAEGGEATVTLTVTPDNATDATATVTSDHPDIADATVNGDLVTVTLKKEGAAVLTITVGGKTVTVNVTVTAAPTLGELTVTAGTLTDGKSLLTLPTPDAGNFLRYKVTAANALPEVEYDTVVDKASGWGDIPADKKVAGTAGQVVTVVEATEPGSKARKAGTATLPAPTPAGN